MLATALAGAMEPRPLWVGGTPALARPRPHSAPAAAAAVAAPFPPAGGPAAGAAGAAGAAAGYPRRRRQQQQPGQLEGWWLHACGLDEGLAAASRAAWRASGWPPGAEAGDPRVAPLLLGWPDHSGGSLLAAPGRWARRLCSLVRVVHVHGPRQV
jgi:hypothetical protein